MATLTNFEQLESWQKARELAREVYSISKSGLFSKDFGLRDQVRRASVSALSNIAEGFERDGTGEFVQFLAMAKGSTGEVKAHLYVALDQHYISEDSFSRLVALATQTGSLIAGLMKYLRRTGFKGPKFR